MQFVSKDVNLRFREIGQSSRVVEIEVGEDDLPDIARMETHGTNLTDGRLLLVKG